MFTPVLRLSALGLAILALLTLVPFLVGAQERNDSDNSTVEAESNTTAEANYNNTRSNRSSISISNETNVCDGVTCPDGSCAATADQCTAEEMAADSVCNGYLCDNGECTSSAAMCGVTEAVDMVADSVCNGYLCDDGQCVSDEAWCGIDFDFEVGAATAADSVCNGYLCDDGTCTSSAAMCGISFDESVASVATCPAASPIRCGDGSCSSEVDRCLAIESQIREGGRTIDAGNAPEQNRAPVDTDADGMPDVRDEDSDGDGLDDGTERAQDYNSTRSNKPSRAVFSDTDADGRPEVSLRGGALVAVNNNDEEVAVAADGQVKCWGQAEDEDGKVYAWGRGICVAGVASENASETAQARLSALQVRGDDVRAWSEEQQAQWREYRESRATSSAEERMIERMVEKTQANERIREITADDDGIEIQYQAEIRLFGFLPFNRTVEARSTAEGEVSVDYPWYRFLSTVPEDSMIRNTLQDLQSVGIGGGGAGKVRM